MPDNKTIRKAARQTFKKHYWFFVAICLVAAILGTEYANTTQVFQLRKRVQEYRSEGVSAMGVIQSSGEFSVLNDIINGNLDGIIESVQQRIDAYTGQDRQIGHIELGHSRGVLASIINEVESGSLMMSVLTAIDTIIATHNTRRMVQALIGLAAMVLLWVFVVNVFKVAFARTFLERRIYDKVPFSRFLYLFRMKKHLKASLSMAVYTLLKYLWMLTIVIYPVKRYAYLLVPYIVAENPDISPLEAIRLSSRMMKGHKWEAFLLELSLLPWKLLSIATGGLVALFFYNPYREAVLAEYHAGVRALFLREKAPGSERLTDRYLYEVPSNQALADAYPDAVRVAALPPVKTEPRTGLWGFTEKYLGIVPTYDAQEKACREQLTLELKKEEYRDTLNRQTYPVRLYPLPAKEKRRDTGDAGYMRHYTIPSLILLFFMICVFGWLWEVALHLLQTGDFVNRGTLHGPWLPIYGGGCAAILALLYKWREKPFLEFILIIVLCGIIEYGSSLILEITHDGQRWWDYSGYYLNLNGRICAEGLLVFGIGGGAFIYVLAPWVDNALVRLKASLLWRVCVVLLAVFLTDVVYSAFVPNTGKGITSVTDGASEIQTQETT